MIETFPPASFHLFLSSDQVKLNDKLMEERDQLQVVVDELREKLDQAFVTQQEVETQRDAALDDISQVRKAAHVQRPKADGCSAFLMSVFNLIHLDTQWE